MPKKPPLRPVEPRPDRAPLSYAQEGLWFLQQLDAADTAYTVPLSLRLAPETSREAFTRALTALVNRHDALRARMSADDTGAPVQRVGEVYTPEVRWHDAVDDATWRGLLAETMRRPFDLGSGCLVRGVGARQPDGGNRVCLTIPHIVADGWSLRVIARDLAALHTGAPLPALPVAYADFAVWQRDWLHGEVLATELSYWREELAESTPLILPTDFTAGPMTGAAAGTVTLRLPPELTTGLLAVGKAERATGFVVAAALFAALLGRWTGQRDLLLGTAMAGRNAAELNDVVGNFVNTVALRIDLADDPSFRELLRRVRRKVLGALGHVDAPFHHVVADVAPRRDLHRQPIFSVVIAHQEFADAPPDPAAPIRPELQESAAVVASHFDLDAETTIRAGQLSCLLLYRADLFAPATIERLRGHLALLARRVAAEPDMPLFRLSLADGPDVPVGPPAAPAAPTPLLEAVLEQARRRPAQDAVATASASLTYADLEAMSAARAARLSAAGVGRGSVVGIDGPWRPEAVVDAFAVLRCAAAYTLLDAADPPACRDAQAIECGVTFLLDDSRPVATGPQGAPDRPLPRPEPHDLAVLVSTPDGPVAVTQANLAGVSTGEPGPAGADRTVLVLDGFPLTPWAVLRDGATCLLPDDDTPVGAVARHAPSTVLLSAEQLAEVLDADPAALHPVDHVVVAGDPAALAQLPTPRPVRRAHARVETTGVVATYAGGSGDPVTIGAAVAGAAAYLLDDRMRPVPPGLVGDLYVGGTGVTAGYLGRLRLTAERFVPDPFGPPGSRLFRSGDRAHVDTRGNLVWLARGDDQVTVAGTRVDPAAVERVLELDPRVRRAVVVTRRTGGRTQLAAFLDTEPEQLAGVTAASARRLSQAELPGHVEAAPGMAARADRATLAAGLRDPGDGPDQEHAAHCEWLIARVWRDVLGTDAFSVTDSFFDVGGHSLLTLPVLAGIRATTGVTLPLATLFELPTIRELARHVARQDDVSPPLRDPGVDRGAPAPLSYAQEALWILDRLGGARNAYNVPMTVRLPAAADRERVDAAIATLVRRHESLRTRFEPDAAGVPRQLVEEPYLPEVSWHDLRDLDEEAAASRTAELFAAVFGEPIELNRRALVRGIVVRDRAACTVMLVFHHIAVDGWSRTVLARELQAAFAGEQLPQPVAHMADFARWQRRWLTGEALERKLRHWRERLAGAEVMELPTRRSRTAAQPSSAAAMASTRLSSQASAGLLRLAASEQATAYAVLAAGLAAHLSVYTGHRDVVFGSGLTGRLLAEMTDMVGLFTNIVMLRADLSEDPSFRTLLRRLREETMTALRHQDAPYELVVKELGEHRDGGRNPLSDVLLVHSDRAGGELAAALRRHGEEPAMAIGPRFEVELHTAVLDGSFAIVAIYRSSAYDPADMQAFLDRLGGLLSAVASDPDQRLSALAGAERPAPELVAGPVEPMPEPSVVALVDQQAARTPHADAIVDRDSVLSYAEVVARANQLARYLRSRGIRRGDVVAVCHRRNAQLVVALLGILKAGAAYLPLDPQHPPRRVLNALDQARPALLLADDLASLLPPGRVPVLRYRPSDPLVAAQPTTAPDVPLGADDVANVIFTSGSTGTPKGVAVRHGGLVNLIAGSRHWLGLGPGDRMMQLVPLTFDVSGFELWTPLCTGAATVAAAVDVLADDLGSLFRRFGATVAFLVPSLLDLVLCRGPRELATLRRLVVGGDVIASSSFDAVHRGDPPRRITAAYGPTETAVFASVLWGPDLDDGKLSGPVPIGRPVANVHWYVLDAALRPVPVGARGEICIGGAGVSRGYVGRPDLTAERFVPDPYGPPGSRMYRTGDIGRQRPDGVMEFGGRTDAQVKIRGYRIELEEVEHAMRSHPAVRFAAAKVHHSAGGPTLAGYYVAEPAASADPADIRRHLAELLPRYAVPSSLTPLAALPLSVHGKLDRDALPEPVLGGQSAAREPRTQLESTVAQLWSELLGRPIGVEDDFFTSGGHSLLVVHATDRVRESLGWQVPLRLLLDHPTVARYAAALESLRRTGRRPDPARAGTVRRRRWDSDRLRTQRRVDLYVPYGFAPEDAGQLLIMPDGSDFVDILRVPSMLDDLAQDGRIPPTPALFVSHPDWVARNAELGEGFPFVDAVMAEALPLACRWLGLDADRVRVVVGGASLGAVAAVTAAVRHPGSVAAVVALSGPLWWSPPGEEPGWLVRHAGDAVATRFHLFAAEGDDPRICDWTGRLAEALAAAGIAARHGTGPGSHTFATWQERLPEGLASVLAHDRSADAGGGRA